MRSVSSYGTAETLLADTLAIDVALAKPEATIDTTGAIGWFLDPDRGRVASLFSSVKMGMIAFEEQEAGYSGGLLMHDYTYKILQERLVLATFGTASVAQVGKLIAFGPSSHEDREASETLARFVKAFVDKLVAGIRNRSLPDEWSESLKLSIYAAYTHIVCEAAVPALVPKHCGTDLAKALPIGMMAAIDSITDPLDCSVHTWRSVMQQAKSKLDDASQARLDELYLDWCFLADVPPRMTDLLFYEACDGTITDGALYTMFYKKWGDAYGEDALVSYLREYHMYNKWARGWSAAGTPNNTNTLERMHETLKGQDMFDHAEGMGTVLGAAPLIGHRFSRNLKPLELVPTPDAKSWKKAQDLFGKGYFNLAVKTKIDGAECIILPSTEVIKLLPEALTTVHDQLIHMRTWIVEFRDLYKKPKTYTKLTDGSWDFNVTVDMLYSFWVLSKITDAHPRHLLLKEAGICYECTCPQFQHYYYCKHCLVAGMANDGVTVPLRMNTTAVGKHKAPAGAKLRKRKHCLQVDA